MSSPVVGTDIRFNCTLGVDITGATSVQVAYLKPGSSTPAYLTATVTTAATGVIYADLPHASNDTPGMWRVYPWVVQSDGKVVSSPSKEFLMLPAGSSR